MEKQGKSSDKKESEGLLAVPITESNLLVVSKHSPKHSSHSPHHEKGGVEMTSLNSPIYSTMIPESARESKKKHKHSHKKERRHSHSNKDAVPPTPPPIITAAQRFAESQAAGEHHIAAALASGGDNDNPEKELGLSLQEEAKRHADITAHSKKKKGKGGKKGSSKKKKKQTTEPASAAVSGEMKQSEAATEALPPLAEDIPAFADAGVGAVDGAAPKKKKKGKSGKKKGKGSSKKKKKGAAE